MEIRLHEDRELFLAAVGYTAGSTGLTAELVEKDYFCSVALALLAGRDTGLVFKGGTALSKVHLGFYRLSEDLDFSIPTPAAARRPGRREGIGPAKAAFGAWPAESGLRVLAPLEGRNTNRQYVGALGYESRLDGAGKSLKVEVGLREPLLNPRIAGEVGTALLDPISGGPAVPGFPFPCLSWDETMAEKLRAALTRREPAIRDFFDLDYAVRHRGLDLRSPDLLRLLRSKLAVPGTDPVDVSPARLDALRRQLQPRLRPVLRPSDFEAFDLETTFERVRQVARDLGL